MSTDLISSYFVLLSINPAAFPILMAVETLSPVRTHTLIPAALRKLIVSGTSSCSLSSMAVDPNIWRLDSMASFASVISLSLLLKSYFA